MEVGRPSSFEVKLNDELLFSKYETTGNQKSLFKSPKSLKLGFPIVDEILDQVEKAVKGEEVAKVTTSAPPVDMGNFFIILIAIALYLYGKPLIQERLKPIDLKIFISSNFSIAKKARPEPLRLILLPILKSQYL